MHPWVTAGMPLVVALIASSGFWAFVGRKLNRRGATNRLLLALAYDKLITQGVGYIERGSVSKDELEDYRKNLWEPYKELGGNGVAEQVVRQVDNLPVTTFPRYSPSRLGGDNAFE